MTDIVERLRKQHIVTTKKLFLYILFHEYVSWGDAADEIERLRKRVELIEGYLRGALNVVESFVHCDTTEARQALGEKE